MPRIIEHENLVSEIKSGDLKSFTFVFNHYFPRLSRFAKNYVIEEAVAKNMVQDAFIKLWENRNNLHNGSPIISYLLVIVKNNCLDYLKHMQVEQRYQQAVHKNLREIELNYQALKRLDIDLLDYKEIEQIIRKTLEDLPEQCRKVFYLSRYEDLPNADIAEKLGISIKAVEANITRALKIFRLILKDYLVILLFLDIPLH